MSIYLCEGLNCQHRVCCEDEEWESLCGKIDTGNYITRPRIIEKTCPCFSDNNVDDIVAETEHLVAFKETE